MTMTASGPDRSHTKHAPRMQVAEVLDGTWLCVAPWPDAEMMPILHCDTPDTARQVARELRAGAAQLDAPALGTTAGQRAELRRRAEHHVRDNTRMAMTGEEMLTLLRDLALLMGEVTD